MRSVRLNRAVPGPADLGRRGGRGRDPPPLDLPGRPVERLRGPRGRGRRGRGGGVPAAGGCGHRGAGGRDGRRAGDPPGPLGEYLLPGHRPADRVLEGRAAVARHRVAPRPGGRDRGHADDPRAPSRRGNPGRALGRGGSRPQPRLRPASPRRAPRGVPAPARVRGPTPGGRPSPGGRPPPRGRPVPGGSQPQEADRYPEAAQPQEADRYPDAAQYPETDRYPEAAQPAGGGEAPGVSLDIPDQIRKLYELVELGILSRAEFEEKKRDLLGRL